LYNDIHDHELTHDSNIVNQNAKRHATPTSTANIRTGTKSQRHQIDGLYLLFDSGSSDSMIKLQHVKHLKHKFVKNKTEYSVAGGIYKTNKEVKVNFSLPEFNDNKVINWKFQIDENDSEEGIGYDIILGRDAMSELGIVIDFNDEIISWDHVTITMRDYFTDRPSPKPTKKEIKAMLLRSEEPQATSEATKRTVKILDATYKKADLEEIVANATQLNDTEKKSLYKLLTEYEELFDGTLGNWNTEEVDLELKEGEKPHSSRYYPMPHIHKETFRKEVKRLISIGVLEEVRESEWGSPTFIIPKKQGTVRFISDFRRLNAKIKRKPYPLPRIADVLQQLEGFQYATTLDLNMGYYTLKLTPGARDMTTIVTEFGKYRYKRLPMGVSCAPDIFQSKINELLGDINGVNAYLDDVLILSKGTFDKHLQQVQVVLERMKRAGLRINAGKSSFGISEVNYLGYVINREGIKPDPKKIQGIMDIERPTTTTEIRRLLGIVQYYRDLWPRRSHILTPLTEAAAGGKKHSKIKWTPELETAFQDIKKMIAKETILSYPDWSIPFTVHTDASDYQLGAVISQNNKPIAFFSRKLNKAQRNYTTTEKELLSIVECLKQFKNILYGYEIEVFSDHKNLVHAATLSESQRVMRWRLILEEYGPNIKHISGKDNIVADAISRMPMANTNDIEESSTVEIRRRENELFTIANEDETNENGFPLDLSSVQKIQQIELNKRNSKLKALIQEELSGYVISDLQGYEIVMYKGKIYVPELLRGRTLQWYHHYLCHPGGDRLAATLQTVCYWKGMTSQARKACKRCERCQKFKKRKSKYGHLPPKNIGKLEPWKQVHVDLIGPYSLRVQQEQPGQVVQWTELQLVCMTFLDPATGWFEIAEVPYFDMKDIKQGNKQVIDKTSARISQIFNDTWLSRYPRMEEVIFDNGSEFKKDFVPLLKDFAVKPKCTTIKNPQSNAPVERVHQVINSMMVTQDLRHKIFDYINPWGPTLSAIAWAIRSSHHSTLGHTPAQLVFGRDMIFNLRTVANWKEISDRKQRQVDLDNLRSNKSRVDFDYQPGQQVYITRDGIFRKLEGPKLGPFTITDIYTNGTVRVQRGIVNERINIRRIEPHHD